MKFQFKKNNLFSRAFPCDTVPKAFLIAFVLFLGSCGPPQESKGGAPGEVAAPNCIGKVIVEKNDKGQIVIGKLTCAGQCPDKSICKPVKNAAKNKEFCGCPGDANPPEGCSTLKVTGRDGKVRVSCGGICPNPTDICMPVRQVLQEGKKWAISCDCRSLEQVPTGDQ